jgi:hypothetical protein
MILTGSSEVGPEEGQPLSKASLGVSSSSASEG